MGSAGQLRGARQVIGVKDLKAWQDWLVTNKGSYVLFVRTAHSGMIYVSDRYGGPIRKMRQANVIDKIKVP